MGSQGVDQELSIFPTILFCLKIIPHGNYAAWTKKEMFLDWLEVEASVFDVGFS